MTIPLNVIPEIELIKTYVENAELYTYEDALRIALERNEQAADELRQDAINLERAADAAKE